MLIFINMADVHKSGMVKLVTPLIILLNFWAVLGLSHDTSVKPL